MNKRAKGAAGAVLFCGVSLGIGVTLDSHMDPRPIAELNAPINACAQQLGASAAFYEDIPSDCERYENKFSYVTHDHKKAYYLPSQEDFHTLVPSKTEEGQATERFFLTSASYILGFGATSLVALAILGPAFSRPESL